MEFKKQKIDIKSAIVFFTILLTASILIYFRGMNQLGYYRDDWNNLYNAYTQGPDMLIKHYQSDRPADGYLLSFVYKIFGPAIYPYLISCLICRFLSAFLICLTLIKIWPKQKIPSFLAGLFFLIFPGFLQQVDGFGYLPHQAAMLCITLSLYLTVLAFYSSKLAGKILLSFFSAIFAIAEMFLMEYYIGLEAFRFLLIFFCFYNLSDSNFWKHLLRSIINYLPWLAASAFFVYWRSFIFDATRNGTDVRETLQPLFSHPKYMGISLLSTLTKNTLKLLFGSWTVQPYNTLNGSDVKTFFSAAVWAILTAICCFLAVFFLRKNKKEDQSNPAELEMSPQKMTWPVQWVILGFLSAILTLAPLILAGREITFSSSLDRFTYPGSICTVIFTVGLVYLIKVDWIRNILLIILTLTAAMTQLVNKSNYINSWKNARSFWWQLSWRAPEISPDSLVVANPGGFSPEEDYEIFSPIHLIYYPDEDHVQVGAEVLNTNTLRLIEMGEITDRTVREIYVQKNYNNLLALTEPTSKSCLQVIDGRNPVYSTDEWSKIPQAGNWSHVDRIETSAETHIPPEKIFGSEPAHGWCWYYEKMSLAQQKEDWTALAELAEEAIQQKAHAEDRIEWIPLVQGLAYTGKTDEAAPYAAILKTDTYLQFETCRYFKNANKIISNPAPNPAGEKWLTEQFCGADSK